MKLEKKLKTLEVLHAELERENNAGVAEERQRQLKGALKKLAAKEEDAESLAEQVQELELKLKNTEKKLKRMADAETRLKETMSNNESLETERNTLTMELKKSKGKVKALSDDKQRLDDEVAETRAQVLATRKMLAQAETKARKHLADLSLIHI